MNLDAGDWIAVIAAAIALASTAFSGASLYFAARSTEASEKSASASETSAEAAKASATAAERSASAGERANELTEGAAASLRAAWTPERSRPEDIQHWMRGLWLVRLRNTGDEIACNVHVTGERIVEGADGVDVPKGQYIQAFYNATVTDEESYLSPIKLTVTWDRPAQFHERGLTDEVTFKH